MEVFAVRSLYRLRTFAVWGLLLSQIITGCAAVDDRNPEERGSKTVASSFIVTPPSYYSTEKARNLGTSYQKNLEHLVRKIRENDITGSLRLANNVDTLGGIGFFTHSANRVPDGRYLEVVVTVSDRFDSQENLRSSIDRVVAKYGQTLLAILSDDSDIYADKRVVGYGLNLGWQHAAGGHSAAGTQTIVIYLPKQKAVEFVREVITRQELLEESVMFEFKGEEPANRFIFNSGSPPRRDWAW
jgi:hypothetical protein